MPGACSTAPVAPLADASNPSARKAEAAGCAIDAIGALPRPPEDGDKVDCHAKWADVHLEIAVTAVLRQFRFQRIAVGSYAEFAKFRPVRTLGPVELSTVGPLTPWTRRIDYHGSLGALAQSFFTLGRFGKTFVSRLPSKSIHFGTLVEGVSNDPL